MEIKPIKDFWLRVKTEQSSTEVKNLYNCTVLRNNEDLNWYKGEWLKIQVNDYFTHIVKPAENIIQIAEIYNISKQDILDKNNLDTEKLFIGQQLKIYKE